jgi:HD-like signal output (HDOD) protein
MDTNALAKRLGGKLNLPSLPDVVQRVQVLVRKPNSSMGEIAAEISGDPPLAARVLRIANSSFYALREPVMDIQHAAAILGLDALNAVVMQVAVADLFRSLGKGGMFDPKDLWEHSVLTAQIAASVPGRLLSGVRKSEAYAVGLFHDIGAFVMFDSLRGEFADAVTIAKDQGRPQFELETEMFGFNHAEVGELVVKRWGLPEIAVRGVGDHHTERLFVSGGGIVSIVALANHIAHDLVASCSDVLVTPLETALADTLELADEELNELYEKGLKFIKDGREMVL